MNRNGSKDSRVKNSGGRNQFNQAPCFGQGEDGEEVKDGDQQYEDNCDNNDEDDDSLSEYRDENAESDEVDEIPGKSLEIRVKKLQTHQMNIKEIDQKMEIQTLKYNNIKDPNSKNDPNGNTKQYTTTIGHNIKATGRRMLTL